MHDPSILEVDDTYYIFGSHMSAASSTDLRTWTSIGNGYTPSNPLFDNLFATEHVFDYSGSGGSVIPTDDGGKHVWAPDVIYNKAQGLYYMYFCTSSTWNASNLCYATSEKPEGPYTWKGALIYSGFTSESIGATDVLDYVTEDYALSNYVTLGDEYDYEDYPNAIDPTVFYDEDGKMWMVYGSWSGGIFLLEIDEATGKSFIRRQTRKTTWTLTLENGCSAAVISPSRDLTSCMMSRAVIITCLFLTVRLPATAVTRFVYSARRRWTETMWT